MTPDQFLDRCKFVCHVGPIGVWDEIAKNVFRTAEQLILESELSEDERQRLLSAPRRESIQPCVDGVEILLRDQGPLFARKDLTSVLGDGLDVGDWVRLLNRRTFFFTEQLSMKKFRDEYVELDGAQEVIWLSPFRVVRLEGVCFELTCQNSGVIARRSGPQKTASHHRPRSRRTIESSFRPSSLVMSLTTTRSAMPLLCATRRSKWWTRPTNVAGHGTSS